MSLSSLRWLINEVVLSDKRSTGMPARFLFDLVYLKGRYAGQMLGVVVVLKIETVKGEE